MRVWLVAYVLGSYAKILEMEDEKVIIETEMGREVREKVGIKNAEDLWKKYGRGFNPYLFADMSKGDSELYKKKKQKSGD